MEKGVTEETRLRYNGDGSVGDGLSGKGAARNFLVNPCPGEIGRAG